ncbi:transcriptional regulatory moc3 [Fusarium sporotrichioides]|uniref:Transcriptional regulatory moc3 n=1 Tax=Fusarium sporotrichioides TaxID=5514 RepID=A0A395SHC3_FUSSP|nr:transcriptional regulatory moc3 [Fusarium sporotrichioides]
MKTSKQNNRRNSGGGRKVKTGCATCRIRKIKCDEAKPFCQKCVKTGRTCDGYESVFRTFPCPSISDNHKLGARKVSPESTGDKLPLSPTTLNRYLSTKTIFGVDINCNREAEQVLQESLTDASIRHALLSLQALREDLESMARGPASPEQQRLSYNYGLQQYSKALTGLALNLSAPSPETLKSALICCQVLISVEQVRGNFSAMGVHIIRGLNIMREYRARPYLLSTNVLMPANHKDLPSIDIFIIKFFAAPCKFTEPPTKDITNMLTPPAEIPTDRKIAPNMRPSIRGIADLVIDFLSQVSLIESEQRAVELLSQKGKLLDLLNAWYGDFETAPTAEEPTTVHSCFLRLLYMIMRVVLLGTLDYKTDSDGKLKAENERIQDLADLINERLKDYDMRKGIEVSL